MKNTGHLCFLTNLVIYYTIINTIVIQLLYYYSTKF